MKLHELRPNEGAHTRRRRLGRGHGSGRVKTSGRGTKGQNARSGKGVKPWFEGGQNPWTAKIPHRRGFSNARFKVVAQVVNLRDLESAFQPQDVVDLDSPPPAGHDRQTSRPGARSSSWATAPSPSPSPSRCTAPPPAPARRSRAPAGP